MGAYQYMLQFEDDLLQKARSYNYPEDTICILMGNEENLRNNFPETYKNLISCRHNRDNRNVMLYGQDLVASWLFEDYLIEQIQNAGLTIDRAGADQERRVLARGAVRAASDCRVTYNGISRPLELMCDYTGYWQRNGTVELRDNKLAQMQTSKSLFLGISTSDNQYILLDMAEPVVVQHIEHYRPYGGKPVDSVTLVRDNMRNVDFPAIAQSIIANF